MTNTPEKLEWFPLYWERFILGTLDMSAEEVGAYILLLCHQWDKGFVPADDKSVRKICRIKRKPITKLLKKFSERDGKLYNNVLENVREEQNEKKGRRSKSGSNAAKARWKTDANALQTHSERNAKGMPLRIEENRIEEEESDNTHAHEQEQKNTSEQTQSGTETKGQGLQTWPNLQTSVPLNPANTVFFTDFEQLGVELMKQTIWLEMAFTTKGITMEQLRADMQDFVQHLKETQQGQYKSLTDAKSHFASWRRKRVYQKPVAHEKPATTTTTVFIPNTKERKE